MPDLGAYVAPVLGAYAVSLALLVAVVVLSVLRAREIKRSLDEAEAKIRNG